MQNKRDFFVSISGFLLLLSSISLAQGDITVFTKNDKFGLKKGEKVVLKPKYEYIRGFQEGLAAFQSKGKWGFINTKGKVAVKAQYDSVLDFSYGLVGVCTDLKYPTWGFINTKGRAQIALENHDLIPFRAQVTAVKYGYLANDWHIISTNGNIVTDSISGFQVVAEDRFLVEDFSKKGNGNYVYIDEGGEKMTPHLKEPFILSDQPSVVVRASDNKQAILTIDCDKLSDWYSKINPFRNGIAFIETDTLTVGAISKTGQVIIPPKYTKLRFSGPQVVGRVNNGTAEYLLDDKGGILAGPYIFKEDFIDGIAIVTDPKGDKYKFINPRGEVISQEFRSVHHFHDGYASVTRWTKGDDVEYAYVNSKGKLISDWYPAVEEYIDPNDKLNGRRQSAAMRGRVNKAAEGGMKQMRGLYMIDVCKRRNEDVNQFQYIYRFKGGAMYNGKALVARKGKQTKTKTAHGAFVTDNAKFGYIDTSGSLVIPYQFDYADNFAFGWAKVGMDGLVGVINSQGEVVIPIAFDEIGIMYTYSPIRAKKNGKWGFIDLKGREMVPFIYDEVESYSGRTARVKLNGQEFLIDKSGTRI